MGTRDLECVRMWWWDLFFFLVPLPLVFCARWAWLTIFSNPPLGFLTCFPSAHQNRPRLRPALPPIPCQFLLESSMVKYVPAPESAFPKGRVKWFWAFYHQLCIVSSAHQPPLNWLVYLLFQKKKPCEKRPCSFWSALCLAYALSACVYQPYNDPANHWSACTWQTGTFC